MLVNNTNTSQTPRFITLIVNDYLFQTDAMCPDVDVLPGKAASSLTCGSIFNDPYYLLLRTLKIGQHLATSQQKKALQFFDPA